MYMIENLTVTTIELILILIIVVDHLLVSCLPLHWVRLRFSSSSLHNLLAGHLEEANNA